MKNHVSFVIFNWIGYAYAIHIDAKSFSTRDASKWKKLKSVRLHLWCATIFALWLCICNVTQVLPLVTWWCFKEKQLIVMELLQISGHYL